MPSVEHLGELASRVLAPNASHMTLDGTNTYVIGEPGAGTAIVVDPGPDDPKHRRRVEATLTDRDAACALVLVTHHHHHHGSGALVGRCVRVPGCLRHLGDERPGRTDPGRWRPNRRRRAPCRDAGHTRALSGPPAPFLGHSPAWGARGVRDDAGGRPPCRSCWPLTDDRTVRRRSWTVNDGRRWDAGSFRPCPRWSCCRGGGVLRARAHR